MAKYSVVIDLCASMTLNVEAESFEEAEKKAQKEFWDEDRFIDEHKKEICIWGPEIDEIIEEEE